MDPKTQSIPLHNDIFLAILSHLAVGDVLAMRQVCRTLRDLTHERSVWIPHYAEMVRERQLPTPMVNPNLSQDSMEAAVRRNKLIESAWRWANPKMESLRFVPLPASKHDWIERIRRGFMVPGGRYLLIFVSDRAFTLSLEELSGAPVPFISLQDVNLEGLDIRTCRWMTGRPNDGSLTFYIAIRPVDRSIQSWTYAFWSASFQASPPSQTYHGQFTIQGSPHNLRTKNELFMYNTANAEHIIVFDWRVMLQGGSFRYYAVRTQDRSRSDLSSRSGIRDFCLLPNGFILTIEYGSNSLSLFASPEFQTVDHLNQLLPMELAAPLWQYHHQSIGDHTCLPFEIWSLPLCHPYTDSDESSALICGLGPSCCYRVANGPEGPEILGHQSLPDGSRFIPGRTKAMVIMTLDAEDGLRIGCLSYAPRMELEGSSPQSYKTFDICTPQALGWELKGRPRPSLSSSQVYFDEESGRMCFLSMDTFLGRHEAGLFMLDFV